MKYDTLVIGGGIAGQEASLNLAYNGLKVLLVEKDLSIGGKMIQLSKVFPTLDCGACIATPKISETARNPNITIMTYSEVQEIERDGCFFKVKVITKPRYINEELCTGCQDCEDVCPVVIDDEYNYSLIGRKAIYIPFNLANPRIAAIDIKNCILCGACEKACQANAIDFTQEEQECIFIVKSIIITTGFDIFSAEKNKEYNYDKYRNVVNAMEMERLLSPTRPYDYVIRPLDGKEPDNIAYVLCTGSRDRTLKNPICSQICCMYSIKQAQLLTGSLPVADITIYYIDIRAFGKGFDEFYEQAKSMEINFVKGKIASITEKNDGSGNLLLRYEDIENGEVIKEAEHDLVVLSVGVLPNTDFTSFFKNGDNLEADDYNYVKQTDELISPAKTSLKGVFVAGTASGPMDIPDAIISAGDASAEVMSYVKKLN